MLFAWYQNIKKKISIKSSWFWSVNGWKQLFVELGASWWEINGKRTKNVKAKVQSKG